MADQRSPLVSDPGPTSGTSQVADLVFDGWEQQSPLLVGDVDVAGRPWKPPMPNVHPPVGRLGSQPCFARTRRSTARGAARWKSLSRTQVGVTTMRTIES